MNSGNSDVMPYPCCGICGQRMNYESQGPAAMRFVCPDAHSHARKRRRFFSIRSAEGTWHRPSREAMEKTSATLGRLASRG